MDVGPWVHPPEPALAQRKIGGSLAQLTKVASRRCSSVEHSERRSLEVANGASERSLARSSSVAQMQRYRKHSRTSFAALLMDGQSLQDYCRMMSAGKMAVVVGSARVTCAKWKWIGHDLRYEEPLGEAP